MELNVLYAINSFYVDITLVSIVSLLENNKNMNIIIHIIEDNFTVDDYKKIYNLISKYSNVDVKFYDFNKFNIEKYGINDWNGCQIANSRLFYQSILKNIESMSNLLYLDGDTVIVGSLEELLTNSDIVSACKDSCLIDRLKKYKLEHYYNSGVLLFNPCLWAKNNCEDRLIHFIENNSLKEYTFPDQDILNIALKDDIRTLNYSYNIGPNSLSFNDTLLKLYYNKHIRELSYEEVKDALNDPKILHSYGLSGIKPWLNNKSNCITPFYDTYLKLLDGDYKKGDLTCFLKICDNHSTLFFTLITLKSYLGEDVGNQVNNHFKKLIKK